MLVVIFKNNINILISLKIIAYFNYLYSIVNDIKIKKSTKIYK